jgi:hypothetical protein
MFRALHPASPLYSRHSSRTGRGESKNLTAVSKIAALKLMEVEF